MRNLIRNWKCGFLLILVPVFCYSQNFTMTGDFSGENADMLVLTYFDNNNIGIKDTIKIINNSFKTSGTLNGTQKALIIGNTSSKGFEDPNLTTFFIEPGNINLRLEENNFKNAVISGSAPQKEYESLASRTDPIRNQLDNLNKSKTENNRKLMKSKLNELKNIELDYAWKNPDSKISPYFLKFYLRQVSKDSVIELYKKFSADNKTSVDGISINYFIQKHSVQANDEAPDFTVEDFSGNLISLSNFKGKYLIIDFWAGWCAPCVKHLPDVKELVNEDNGKNIDVLYVSFDNTKEDWKKNISKHELNGSNHTFVGFDNVQQKGSLNYKYGVQPIPAYILIDREGKIVERYLGASKKDKGFNDLKSKLEELLKN